VAEGKNESLQGGWLAVAGNQLAMSKLRDRFERNLKIIFALHPKKRMTLKQLADKFGVHERTIRRDIDFLSCFIPIYQDKQGFTIIDRWWKQFEQ